LKNVKSIILFPSFFPPLSSVTSQQKKKKNMIRPSACKNTRSDKPENILVYLKGWGNGSIYDYAANVDPTTNVRTPAFITTYDVSSNVSLPGTPGDWSNTTKYCFQNTSGETSNAVYLYSALNPGSTTNNTLMSRFYINTMPGYYVNHVIMFNGLSGGIGPYGGYGYFIEGGTNDLYGLSGNYTVIGPITTLYSNTWYNIALTIDGSYNWTTYLNGTQYNHGGIYIYGIVYGGLSFLGNFASSGYASEGMNGYITDCIFADTALSSNVCMNFSSGGSIF
jgi:hypothetical protein